MQPNSQPFVLLFIVSEDAPREHWLWADMIEAPYPDSDEVLPSLDSPRFNETSSTSSQQFRPSNVEPTPEVTSSSSARDDLKHYLLEELREWKTANRPAEGSSCSSDPIDHASAGGGDGTDPQGPTLQGPFPEDEPIAQDVKEAYIRAATASRTVLMVGAKKVWKTQHELMASECGSSKTTPQTLQTMF